MKNKIAYYLSKFLPKGMGVVVVNDNSVSCFGLLEEERKQVGINLIPTEWVDYLKVQL